MIRPVFDKVIRAVFDNKKYILVTGLLILSTLMAFPPVFAGDCLPKGKGELVTVVHVYDGDTVRLKDGRRVRLLGINTPELGQKGERQPFAKDAAKAVERFLALEGKTYLYSDLETHDKYGRYLAHLFKEKPDGGSLNLEEELLIQGLAYHVAIPPNLEMADCLAHAEKLAQRQRRGLWRSARLADKISGSMISGSVSKGGYQRIVAQVSQVALKKAWWITFNKGFTAVIYSEHQHFFDRDEVKAWQGNWLEVEGWVYKSSYKGKPQWRLKLETPYAVSEIPGDHSLAVN